MGVHFVLSTESSKFGVGVLKTENVDAFFKFA